MRERPVHILLALLLTVTPILCPAASADLWPGVIHLSPGIEKAFHQYYDIPAWNADGTIILFRGPKERVYLCRKPGKPSVELTLPAKPAGSVQWDRNDPRILYYVTREENKRTVVHRYSLLTGKESVVCRIEDLLNLAPPHEDAEHLLLYKMGSADPVWLVSLRDGKARSIPVPGAVHRVRFTRAADLSIFCNVNGENDAARTSWILNAATGKAALLMTGQAGHPDWQPGGRLISFFQEGGLMICDRQGQQVGFTPGLNGHQSWSRDGRYIVVDENSKKGAYAGFLVLVETATGRATRLTEHRSKLANDQATHPHPQFSPDGRWVLFNSNNGGKTEPQVYLAEVG